LQHVTDTRSRVTEEERTRVCPAAVLENLLETHEDEAKTPSSAADEETRVGQIPIEELVIAAHGTSNVNVGNDDVTRAYSVELPERASPTTSPGRRRMLAAADQEPRVIVQTDRPPQRAGWLSVLLLVVVSSALALGWIYRAPLHHQAVALRASLHPAVSRAKAKPDNAASLARPATSSKVTLSISVSPADAVLAIDGARVANPYLVQRNVDSVAHEITAEAPGYVQLQRRVQFDRDLTVVMALAPVAPKTDEPQSVAKPVAQVASEPPRAPTGKSRSTAPVKATKLPVAAANCSKPYVVDAAGIKTFKPECL
jgi:hypothetical protein